MVETIELFCQKIEDLTKESVELDGEELIEKLNEIDELQRRLEHQISIESKLRFEADYDERVEWERFVKKKELSIETLKAASPMGMMSSIFNRMNLKAIMEFEKTGETISKPLLPWVKPKEK